MLPSVLAAKVRNTFAQGVLGECVAVALSSRWGSGMCGVTLSVVLR